MADQVAELLTEVKSLKDTVVAQADNITRIEKYFKEPQYPAGGAPGELLRVPATPIDHKKEGEWGFKSLRDQLIQVREAAISPHKSFELGNHLIKAAERAGLTINKATGLSEGLGSDGGFLLAPTFINTIMEIMHQQYNLLDETDKYDINGPSVKIPRFQETSRATGSRRGGIRGYWVSEGGTMTASKPTMGQISMTPHKLAVLAYTTEELLNDGGSMLEQIVSRAAAEEINFLVNDSLINGTGAGQPLGILNAPCLVSVTKETGQAAASIVHENIVKMWARLHVSARQNAVWLINQDTEPQLHTMSLGVGTGGLPSYLPPGGLTDKPYATLMGRPVRPIEQCATLGTVGDIILGDMKQMLSCTRGVINAAMSMHVQFVTDENAYRFTFRVDSQPWWPAALTPYKGSSNTQSTFVALGTRS